MKASELKNGIIIRGCGEANSSTIPLHVTVQDYLQADGQVVDLVSVSYYKSYSNNIIVKGEKVRYYHYIPGMRSAYSPWLSLANFEIIGGEAKPNLPLSEDDIILKAKRDFEKGALSTHAAKEVSHD